MFLFFDRSMCYLCANLEPICETVTKQPTRWKEQTDKQPLSVSLKKYQLCIEKEPFLRISAIVLCTFLSFVSTAELSNPFFSSFSHCSKGQKMLSFQNNTKPLDNKQKKRNFVNIVGKCSKIFL